MCWDANDVRGRAGSAAPYSIVHFRMRRVVNDGRCGWLMRFRHQKVLLERFV
jgi:hypothetical protein